MTDVIKTNDGTHWCELGEEIALQIKLQVMVKALPFTDHVAEYEAWYKKYPYVFKSEAAAIKELLPKRENIHGMEVGIGTSRFAKALGIKEGIEPAENMRRLAQRKGIFVLNAVAEKLPYKALQFDVVLMNFCISYFNDIQEAFKEASRVLKRGGCLVVGFIDKNSRIGKFYEDRKPKSIFYKKANFYSVRKIESELKKAGFKELEFSQTLFHDLDKIKTIEASMPGYGKGSFVLVKAIK